MTVPDTDQDVDDHQPVAPHRNTGINNRDTTTMTTSTPQHLPWGYAWRSHTLFAIFTVGIAAFTDAFLYGLVVPILPSILESHVGVPESKTQFYVSQLLSTFAISSVLLSPVMGTITDKAKTRQVPFLVGLGALIAATVLLFTARTIALLTMARVLQGGSAALVWTVGLVMCRDVVGSENLGKTTGSIFGFVSFGTVFAPVAGGVLYKAAGIRTVEGLALGLLGVDFLMRLFVIEKKIETKSSSRRNLGDGTSVVGQGNGHVAAGQLDDETAPLLDNHGEPLSKDTSDVYFISPDQPWLIRQVPILYCFKSPSLSVGLYMMFIQGIFAASFDATVPLHARTLFGFDEMGLGLLFAPLGICNLLIGPLAGWTVDRKGTRIVAVAGFLLLAIVFALLRLPSDLFADAGPERTKQIALYCVLLGLAGMGLGIITSPPIVECGATVEEYHKRNPDFFGGPDKGPYAQLYGISNMLFCLGLSIGPIIAGGLRTRIGYGNMNAVLAGFSAITALVCGIWLNGKRATS